MYDYIRGTLAEKEVTRVVIDAHGVGYEMNIPLSTYEKLQGPGSEVKMLTHFHVREDAQKLYGFFSALEREVFRQLINISGIGPKVALNILSGIAVEELVRCINSADSSRLEKIPGIGAKTAQRLLIELKGKLLGYDTGSAGETRLPLQTDRKKNNIRDEAFAAMMSLGYNDKQVAKALSRVEQTVTPESLVEEWIRKALQVI